MPSQTILCINKDDRQNPYERILRVGGVNPGGARWSLSQREAIQYIKDGWDFYVERPPGDRVRVEVARSRFDNDYIKTEADGDEPNNLLSLLECP
jgi:hypothetical protein